MNSISQKVIGKLKQKQAQPLPAWQFTLRSLVTWLGFLVFVGLGSLAVSVMLFLVTAQEYTRLAMFRGGPLGYWLRALPLLWLFVVLLLLVAAYFDFRRTESGYRYRSFVVIGALVAISLLGGFGLHAAGVGQRTDAKLEKFLPRYRQFAPHGKDVWHRPESGMLVGQVTGIEPPDLLEMRFPREMHGRVRLPASFTGPLPEIGDRLRIFGDPISIQDIGSDRRLPEIDAETVLPWKPGLFRGPKPGANCEREEGACDLRSKGERSKRPLGAPGRHLNPNLN
jgi:hypothetical protein